MSASAILKLQKVGFTAEQVEALADLIDTQAASKADLERGISAVRTDLEKTEHRLDTRITEIKTELKAEIAELKIDAAANKADLLKVIIGVMVVNSAVVMGAMFGLAKLLGH